MTNLFCCLLFLSLGLSTFSQHIRYQFSAPNALHHEAEIVVDADGITTPVAVFKMSRSSPGRYAKHEFGKNVYNVRAYDTTGKPLKVEKGDADVYRVTGHKGTVKLTYTLFADYPDGTYASIDISGYHLNMPACFMWVKGMEKVPITVQFAVPVPAWKIATQLKQTSDKYTFTAPGLQYFMDAPIKIGNLHIREWTVTNTDKKPCTFRLALEADASDLVVDSFTEKLKRIVLEAKDVFGELPKYDFGTYTFIASINPYMKGDGMEHRNSTMITIPADFNDNPALLSVFAHEFFHCWNVERIRPKSLEPFNFENSNMSDALWVAEGFTQYYGTLLRMRAGLLEEAEFLKIMSGLVNAKNNTPGGKFYSPIESSQRAVFVDAGVSIDRNNYSNMYTSYYLYGGALALALDLELRSRFHKSLDDLMKELWKKHGKTEIPYTIANVQGALATITDPAYAASFFESLYSPASQSTTKLCLLQPAIPLPWLIQAELRLSLDLGSTKNGFMISKNTVRDTPIYTAGLDAGDVIVELNGRKLGAIKDVGEIIDPLSPGSKIPVKYLHRNTEVNTSITLFEDPLIKIEKRPTGVSEKQRQLRDEWIHGL